MPDRPLYQEQFFESYSEQESAMENCRQEYHQIDDGPFRGSVARADFGPLRIFREHVSRGILQSFEGDEAHVSVGLNLPWSSHAHLLDFSLAPGEGSFAWGGGESRIIMDAGHDVAIVVIPAELLTPERPRPVAPVPAQDLAVWIYTLMRHAQEGRNSALFALAPDLLLDRVSIHVGLCQASKHRAPPDARQVWRQITNSLTEMDSGDLTVTALARRLGRSKETLRSTARDVVDRDLDDLLVRTRLSRARRVLASGAARSVTGAALDHGFLHLSRFAQAYRKTFGERPSQTLRRGRGPGGGERQSR